jgi:hypothetical protein
MSVDDTPSAAPARNRCYECGALDVELGWAYVCRQCWPGPAADFTEPF